MDRFGEHGGRAMSECASERVNIGTAPLQVKG